MDTSTEPAPEPVTASRIKLRRKATVEDAFVTIMKRCLRHLEANVPAALIAHDPEGVHQMRIAIRRLRSAVAVFRPALVSPRIDGLAGEAGELADTLGAVRDLDVFRDELLDPVIDHYGRTEGLRILGEIVEGRRIVAWANALAATRSPRVKQLIAESREVLKERDWRGGERKGYKLPVKKFACEVLKHRHKSVTALARKMDRLSLEKRHRMRVRVKKLRYSAEFFESLYPKDEARPYIKALSRFQDELGYLTDVAMAESLLERITGGSYSPKPLVRAEGLVLGWHGAVADEAWLHAAKRWKKLTKKDPFWA